MKQLSLSRRERGKTRVAVHRLRRH
jgi:hypothetical protein